MADDQNTFDLDFFDLDIPTTEEQTGHDDPFEDEHLVDADEEELEETEDDDADLPVDPDPHPAEDATVGSEVRLKEEPKEPSKGAVVSTPPIIERYKPEPDVFENDGWELATMQTTISISLLPKEEGKSSEAVIGIRRGNDAPIIRVIPDADLFPLPKPLTDLFNDFVMGLPELKAKYEAAIEKQKKDAAERKAAQAIKTEKDKQDKTKAKKAAKAAKETVAPEGQISIFALLR